MTREERTRPEVQKALKTARGSDVNARAILEEACKTKGVDFKKFRLELDIGAASPDERDEAYDPLTYSSPNVMYDERKKRVFFIDLGWGIWTPDKQKVFDHLMNTEKIG